MQKLNLLKNQCYNRKLTVTIKFQINLNYDCKVYYSKLQDEFFSFPGSSSIFETILAHIIECIKKTKLNHQSY